MKRKGKNQGGQAAVEFIIVCVVVFFFLFFFLSICMAMVLSEYAEYATFMAARTYKAAFTAEVNQREYAQRVFNSYFFVNGQPNQPKIPTTLIDNINIQFDPGGPRGNLTTGGVRARFQVPFFYLPPLFLPPPPGGIGSANKLTLTTESYLGREPTLTEVQADFQKIVESRKLNFDSNSSLLLQMDDNGN